MILTINADDFAKEARRIKALQEEYRSKVKDFIQELIGVGIPVIYRNLYGAGDSEPPDLATTTPHVMMGVRDGNMFATLRLRGEDVMFVEFGAGVHYNGPPGQSPNPKGAELGYTIGSYGLGQGRYDHWWYTDDNGEMKVSYGTEATMPMYKADMEIQHRYIDIARKVFGS